MKKNGKFSRREWTMAIIIAVLAGIIIFLYSTRDGAELPPKQTLPEDLLTAEDMEGVSGITGDDIFCYLENRTVTPETDVLYVTMENLGEKQMAFDILFPLERLEAGKWHRIKRIGVEDSHTLDVPHSVQPQIPERDAVYLGEEYPHLTPGVYRLVIQGSQNVFLHFMVNESEDHTME